MSQKCTCGIPAVGVAPGCPVHGFELAPGTLEAVGVVSAAVKELEGRRQHYRILIDDGQRAYRLRYGIGDHPNFEDSNDIAAWKAGYRAARQGVSLDTALATFLTTNLKRDL